jgi:hypothetical protein
MSCEAPSQTMACGETSSEGCTCNLQSESPVSIDAEVPVTFFRYRVQLRVLDECDSLNRDESTEEASKPLWTFQDEIYKDDDLFSIESYPNPPPAAA